jgi:transposase
MNEVKEFVGIDISKDSFDTCDVLGKYDKFSNNVKGFKIFEKTLNENSHCVMEQTGRYHQPLAHYLRSKGHKVSVENALVIKHFSRLLLKSVKTDKADAKLIRDYAIQFSPKEWQEPKIYISKCREIRALVLLLQKQQTAFKNQSHSLKSSVNPCSEVLKFLCKELKEVKKKIKALEKVMEELVRENESEMLTHLSTIPGVGKRTAMMLIVFTNAFEDFENGKQLSSYFGLAPRIRQSGSSLNGKSIISKAGNKDMRKMMFMCSLSASNYNKGCQAQFLRIVNKGKPKKVALIAVSNKLLKIALAVAKSQMPYDENFRSVKRA